MKKHILTLAVVLMSTQAFANIGGNGDQTKCPFGDNSARSSAPRNDQVIAAQVLNGKTPANQTTTPPGKPNAKL